VRRRLLGHTLRRPPRLGLLDRRKYRLAELDPDQALDRLDRWGWHDAPWQLQPQSLAHLPALAMGDQAVVIGRRRGRRFWLYALAVDPAARGAGIGRTTLAALNAEWIAVPALVPEEWAPLHGFLRALGAEHDAFAQWEMTRPLGE